jgi:hypothetical protein
MPVEPIRTLFLTEEPIASFVEKLERFGIARGDPNFGYIRRSEKIVSGLAWPKIVERVTVIAIEGEWQEVVIDVLGKWAAFKESQENDAGVTREAIDQLDPLMEAGIATWILHHSPWTEERSRGSGAIAASVDQMYYIAGSGTEARSFKSLGGRRDAFEHTIPYRIGVGEDGVYRLEMLGKERKVGATKTTLAITAVEGLGGSATAEQVAAVIEGWSEWMAEKWLGRAYRYGLLKRSRGPHNKLTYARRGRFEYLKEV